MEQDKPHTRMTVLVPLLAVVLLCCQQPVSADVQDFCNLNLQIRSANESYDLTSMAYSPVTAAGRRAGQPAEATVQLCSAGPCAAPAAACVADPAGGTLVADAGRISDTIAPVVKNSWQLQLDLAPGQPCVSQGRNTTFNTSILFICDQSSGQDSAERPAAVMGDCSLLVVWHTAAACPRPAAAPPPCPLLAYRPLHSQPGLRGLASARWRLPDGTAVIEARLCGGAVRERGPCAGAPLCVTDPDPEPLGAADRPARLTVTNNSVTLSYGRQGEGAAEVLLRCNVSAGAGRLVLRSRQPQLLLTLESSVLCPVSQVPCQVTAEDGTVRDLSSLSLKTGAWETADLGGGRYLINVCRAISHDSLPKLCGGVAGTAVCLQTPAGPPASLGAVAGPPTLMADGSVAILYTNGSRCGPSGRRMSSELQLVCGPGGGGPVLVAAADCRYTFLWETPAACGPQESSGSDCAVSEPLYGHRLDTSSLRRTDSDYSLPLEDGSTLFLNLCGPLVRHCAGTAGQGACLLAADGTETSYGLTSSRLWHADGVLQLRLAGGAPCVGGGNHSTRVVLTCHQGAPAAALPGLWRLGCHTDIVVPARQACPPRSATDCRTQDGKYDLSSLTALTGNYEHREQNATYVINVCHSVNPEEGVNCPPTAGTCLVTGGAGQRSYLSLGAVSGGPVLEDIRLVLRYRSGQPCDGPPAGRHRSSEIHFSCDPAAVGTQPRLVSSDGCLYQFAWTTASACAVREERSAAGDCTVHNPQTGYRFNLSALSRPGGYNSSLRGAQYRLNVCSALKQTANCTAGTGICKTTADSPGTEISVGAANGNLVFDGGMLLLNYSEGAACPSGGRYRAVITFYCDPEVGRGAPRVVEDQLCTVTVHWPTQLACQTGVECSVDTPQGLVDLTGLMAPGGALAEAPGSSGGQQEQFRVAVCRPLPPTAGPGCPPSAAACRHNGTQYQSLGHVVSAPRLRSGHVVLRYEGGAACSDQPDRSLSTELRFVCDASRPPAASRPGRPQYADCVYAFEWRTAAACPLPPAAAAARRRCRLRRPDGAVTDLATLTAAQSEQVPFEDVSVRLRLCQADEFCGGAVCVGNDSFGDPESFTVSQAADHSFTMEYSTDRRCQQTDGGAATRGATLRLTCDPSVGRGTPRVTQVTACHVTAEWHSAAVCGAAPGSDPPDQTAPPAVRGTGHAVAWLLLLAVVAATVAVVVCRGRWRHSCSCRPWWDALRHQLLSPGTRASAHYRPVLLEEAADAAETEALLLDAPLEDQRSPSPPLTEVQLRPPSDSDDELLLV